MTTEYTVIIENCNSIDQAKVKIKSKSLNIKYGPNGLGKSTIAKAIVGIVRNDGSLGSLLPFKSRGKVGAPQPTVTGADSIKSALVFDDEYVSQFVFQQDEVVKNSFNIFIKTPDYDAAMQSIEELFKGIREAFNANADIDQAIRDLKDLRDAFGKTNQDGSISKSSKVFKAYGSGNKVAHIPTKLAVYEPFIRSADPAKWIGWQIKGNEFLALGEQCPYCSGPLPEAQKDIPRQVAKEYDATTIGHLNNLKAIIERLGSYFSETCRNNIDTITKSKVELNASEKSFLSGLKSDIDALIIQLESLRSISFFSLRDVDEIGDKIQRSRINLSLCEKLDSAQTRGVVDPINMQLDELHKQVGILKGNINRQKAKIKKSIEENQASINAFLRSAGYKYSVVISSEPDSYKMKLYHKDLMDHIEGASRHLSYGERNAFALVLFMHQVLSENPDIVVLDDPISSFDKNKKFAILHELFQGKASLRNRTTLMLTHDIEPAIDVIKSTRHKFAAAQPVASFLSSRGGVVTEVAIEAADIMTFAKICTTIMASGSDDIVKAIYVRRYYEIFDELGEEYNMLASLFHKREKPTIQLAGNSRDMTADEIAKAQASIRNFLPNFDYTTMLAQVTDDNVMRAKFTATTVGYEKIQIFRIIRGAHDDDVIAKFINETYHIENEYLMQLNPHVFESVPEYVVDECTRLLTNP